MHSVHEILAGLTLEEYPALTSLILEARGRRGRAKIIVLDEATRSRALRLQRERQLQQNVPYSFELNTAC